MEWLKQNSIAFQSIAPDNTDFSDLAPLKQIIGNARVVQLGEQSHGDGECFLAKTRLVAFLHQEMGFDILAMESGFYDCRDAWKSFQQGDSAYSAAKKGVFGIWTGSRQTSSLWDYLSKNAKTSRPLELVGFDCQFTASASRDSLVDALVALSKKLDLAFEQSFIDAFTKNMQLAIEGNSKDCDFGPVLEVLQKLLDELMRADHGFAEAERGYWSQLLISSIHQIEQIRNPSKTGVALQVNGRDAKMAENLLWYVRTFPNRKVVVWAASFHIARNLEELKPLDQSLNYKGTIPMGHIVHEALGQACFSIGFTAYEGTAGAWFRKSSLLESAPAGTLEAECNEAGLINALIPLRTLPLDCWLNEPVVARPLGYAWMEARWPRHFDAMIFQRTMTPSTSR